MDIFTLKQSDNRKSLTTSPGKVESRENGKLQSRETASSSGSNPLELGLCKKSKPINSVSQRLLDTGLFPHPIPTCLATNGQATGEKKAWASFQPA